MDEQMSQTCNAA